MPTCHENGHDIRHVVLQLTNTKCRSHVLPKNPAFRRHVDKDKTCHLNSGLADVTRCRHFQLSSSTLNRLLPPFPSNSYWKVSCSSRNTGTSATVGAAASVRVKCCLPKISPTCIVPNCCLYSLAFLAC